MKISVVMPVHNEEEYLPYSLASLRNTSIDELVVVLDRCTDRSEQIVNQFREQTSFSVQVIYKSRKKWRHIAETWQHAIEHASNEIVYPLGADIFTDLSMFNIAPFTNPKVAFATYRHYPYRLGSLHLRESYEKILSKTLDTLGTFRIMQFGVFGLRKSIFEELGGLRDVVSAFDDYKQRALEAGYKCVHDNSTNILHLRPEWDACRQYYAGVGRWEQLHYPLWKVVVHCFLHMKPYVLPGYLYAKRMK